MKKELSAKHSKNKYYIMLALVGGLLLTACGGKEAAAENTPPTAETNVETDSGDAAMPSETATPEGDGAAETENDTSAGNSASAAQELDGSIDTLGDHIFTISKNYAETDENGDAIVYSSKEEAQTNVAYTDTTSFIICTSKDMGITTTNTPATSAALEIGRPVYVKGSWNGDVFNAAEVTIYHFEY